MLVVLALLLSYDLAKCFLFAAVQTEKPLNRNSGALDTPKEAPTGKRIPKAYTKYTDGYTAPNSTKISSLIRTITVGYGIAPYQPPLHSKSGSRTVTAGRELHPAPKNHHIFVEVSIVPKKRKDNGSFAQKNGLYQFLYMMQIKRKEFSLFG